MIQWESKQQIALFEWAIKTQKNIYAHMFHIPNGRKRSAREGHMLKLEGVKAGVPDVFLALPNQGYHGLFIEMKPTKQHKSSISSEQKEWHGRLRDAGYRVEVCYGWEMAANVITEYLGLDPQKPKREAANEQWMAAA